MKHRFKLNLWILFKVTAAHKIFVLRLTSPKLFDIYLTMHPSNYMWYALK